MDQPLWWLARWVGTPLGLDEYQAALLVTTLLGVLFQVAWYVKYLGEKNE